MCAERGAALLDPFAGALEAAGLGVVDRHVATAADVADLGSSWAKRLGIPTRRPAWSLAAAKGGCGPPTKLTRSREHCLNGRVAEVVRS